MAEYVLIETSSGSPKKFTESDREAPDFPPDVSHKGLEWLPVVRKAKPEFDPSAEKLAPTEGVVLGEYVYGWDVLALTPAEMDALSANQDLQYVQREIVGTADVLIELVDVLLAKAVITPSDFNEASRQKYQALKQRIDRIRVR